jgi:hypothetical protein
MTKQQVINKLEDKNIDVLFIGMDNGKPKATISWRDYLKIRDDADLNKEYKISLR